MNTVPEKINNRIKKYNLSLKQLLIKLRMALPYDMSNTVVLTGAPRSGTTWLGEILNTIPKSAILFEPLHIRRVPEAKNAGIDWVTLLEEGKQYPEIYQFMKQVLSGRIINNWTSREFKKLSNNECLTIRTWIIKFVRAQLMLEWMAENFPIRRPLLIIRHPCAVVASQIRREWRYRINPETLRNESILKIFPQLEEKLHNLDSIEEYLAAKWCLDYYYALYRKKSYAYELVIYEKMVKNGEDVLKQIFTALEMEVPKEAFSQIKIPSITAHHGDPWKKGPLLGWTKVLNRDQIKLILDVVETFGMDFYTDELEPDYDRLENSPLSSI